MELTMPYVRVKQKHQVTIPLEIRKKINLHEGDTLEAKEMDGVIILTPQIITSRTKEGIKEKKSSLLSLMGVNKDSGLYKDAKDADNYIDNLRNEWN